MHHTKTPEFIFPEFGVSGIVRVKKIIDHKVIKEICSRKHLGCLKELDGHPPEEQKLKNVRGLSERHVQGTAGTEMPPGGNKQGF